MVSPFLSEPLEVKLNHKLSEDQGDLLNLNLMTQKAVSETCEASISYLIITRPDITHAVSVVSQFMQSLRFQLYLMVHRPYRCKGGRRSVGRHYCDLEALARSYSVRRTTKVRHAST